MVENVLYLTQLVSGGDRSLLRHFGKEHVPFPLTMWLVPTALPLWAILGPPPQKRPKGYPGVLMSSNSECDLIWK